MFHLAVDHLHICPVNGLSDINGGGLLLLPQWYLNTRSNTTRPAGRLNATFSSHRKMEGGFWVVVAVFYLNKKRSEAELRGI